MYNTTLTLTFSSKIYRDESADAKELKEALARGYIEVCLAMTADKTIRDEFFGLRDFYRLADMTTYNIFVKCI